jgi:DNA ligase-4
MSSNFAAQVPFSAVVELFERVLGASKHAKKRELLLRFFEYWTDKDYFPILRLLLPQFDKERQTYGLKETYLAKYIIKILGIAPTSGECNIYSYYILAQNSKY